MVKAFIDIDKDTNRVLNVVKARFDLRDKSQAIQVMAEQYEEEFLGADLNPKFIEKASKIRKQKPIKIGDLSDFRKKYEIG